MEEKCCLAVFLKLCEQDDADRIGVLLLLSSSHPFVCVCQCVLRVDDVFFRSALQVALGSGSSRLCLSSFSSSAVQNEVLPRLSARLASSCFPISNNSRRLKRHC